MRRRQREVREGFWISYADLTTGLLLIFIVLVAAMIAHYRNKQEAILTAVDGLVLVRHDLAMRLKEAAETTNLKLGYQPGDTNAFKFDPLQQRVHVQEGAWFDVGEATLKPEAERAIAAFFPVLYDAMLQGGTEAIHYLAAIEIQGHTDPNWRNSPLWSWDSYYQNTLLSQQRAAAVAAYMGGLLDAGDEEERRWRPFFAYVQTAGRSWMESYCQGKVLGPQDFQKTDPCPGERRLDDDPRSRRVTFGVRVDDQKVLEQIEAELERESGPLLPFLGDQ